VLTEEAARCESDRCLYCCLTCYNPDAADAAAGEFQEKQVTRNGAEQTA